METLKKYWYLVIAAIGSIVGLLLFQKKRINDLVSKLASTLLKEQSIRLEERSKVVDEKIKEKELLSKDIEASIKEKKVQDLDPDQVKKYWDNK